MYQLKDQNQKPFLNYRHNAKQKKQLSQLPSITFDGDDSITPNEIIEMWSAFAKGACVGKFKETLLPCWIGHYEQFGRLMYELYAISENRGVHSANHSAEIASTFPLVENLTFILLGPHSSEDRTFYRIWFATIKHPDFSSPNINDPDYLINTFWTRCLQIVYNELN